MKSLPENEMFNALENRLRNFTEEPDDEVWSNITRKLPAKKPVAVWFWVDHSATAAAMIALFFLLWSYDQSLPANRSRPVTDTKRPTEIAERVSLDDEKGVTTEDSNDLKRNHENNSTKDLSPVQGGKLEKKTHQQYVKSSSAFGDESVDQSEQIIKVGHSNDPAFVSGGKTSDPDSLKANLSLQNSPGLDEKSAPPSEKKKKAKKLHPTFYLSVTPSLSYLKVMPLENDDIVVDGLASESIFSANRVGFGLDAGLQHRFAKRWEVYLGVNYYGQNQQITYQYQTESVTVESASKDMTYNVTPGQAEERVDYTMRNAGVSAGVFYLIKEGRLQHKAGVGLQYQRGFFTTQRETEYYNSESTYLSYQLTYRAEYQINTRVSAFLQPNFTCAIQAHEHLDAPFTIKPYRAGIGFGLTYRF